MPKSRAEGLVIQEFPEETLVYDVGSHKAHCLNQTAAAIWRQCDGTTSVAEVARRLEHDTGLPADERIVWMALDQLGKAALVEGSAVKRTNRRQALKRIGITSSAAVLLPLITSIIAPTAAMAVTCRATGAACTSSAQCCSGLCRTASSRCA